MAPFICKQLDINTDEIADKVFRLQHYWISRSDDFGFYTLGRNAYLDGRTPAYKEEVKTLNPILLKNFSDTYQIIIDHLSDQFKEPVVLNETLAYPSFHIFVSSPILLTHAGNWHEDYPHLTLGLGDKDPYTFTIAIKLPEGGAGMDYIEDGMQKYLEYKKGMFVGHDGKTMHRISSLKRYKPHDFRITLQGHIIRLGGKLTLFW